MSDQLKHHHVLVVDPSESTRLLLKQHLEKQGAIVYTCGVADKIKSVIDGTNANGMPISLVLVDVRLAETQGLYVLKLVQFAITNRRIPILVMSHSFSNRSKSQMRDYGAFGYLRKPFDLIQLDEFVQERLQVYESFVEVDD